ncbi:MAG: phospho-sugar mutase [Solirubrobacteraceae bacterium]
MAGGAATIETLVARVERWIAADPDPAARAELRALVDRGAWDELRERFAHGLTFGTAGLRGRLGAGPSRMNVATVRAASAGLVPYLLDTAEGAREAGVVVGHDARHGSRRFAAEAAAVFTGGGLTTYRLPPLAPTPLTAFAVRHLGCAAGVMVTASHNPPQDNGYKVYLGDGAQIAPPADERIAAEIARVDAADALPLGDGGQPVDVAGDYLTAILGALPAAGARDVRIVYTPLHGVGAPLCLEALRRAGFPDPHVVAAQAEPDPDFPTVARPNPEEPGTLDLALADAAAHDADVMLANDPDADRLAVAIPVADGWRRLQGDEIGALLADFLLEHCEDPRQALLVTTIASSTLLGKMAAAAGAAYAETLTGFKWMMRAVARTPGRRLLLAYEEALGYAVSDVVRDKDGISAALVMAQLVASEKRAGRSLQDRLEAIAARFGAHATGQLALELEGADGQARMRRITGRLRTQPPTTLLGRPVESVEDLAAGGGREGLPPADVLILRARDVRVVVRPSGTEPKLKGYLEVVAGDLEDAAEQLAALHAELARVIGA